MKFGFGHWGTQLGFDAVRDRAAGTSLVTAAKNIDGLKQLVVDDNPWKPATPYSKALNNITPARFPKPDDPARGKFERREVSWFRSVCGHLQQIAKVRHDAMPAINMCARFVHKPTAEAKQADKHIIYYLLHTRDHGLCFGMGAATMRSDLEWTSPLANDHAMDPLAKATRIPSLL